MENSQIYKFIDHTLLKPVSTWEQIKKLCDEAIQYKTASVCIPPSFIDPVKKEYDGKINICTVIGFPLGYSTKETKVFEATDAIKKGANEIDMVINIGDAKDGNFSKITSEISAIKQVVGEKILKVIIETCYLTDEEKIKLCECVSEAKANYIKTSTGFGTNGATIEDINLFKEHIDKHIKMKAAGGVKSKEDLEMFIDAGCERIGTSSAITILTSGQNNGGY